MLPKTNRLKKKRDFDRVFKRGEGFKEGFLFLKLAGNNLKVSRFGFVVGKRVSKKAVLRNKVKKRLKMLVNIRLPKIKAGLDVVLVVFKGLEAQDLRETEESMDKLFKKAKIWDR